VKLIDTHQHLIYRERFGYGWTAGVPALAEGDYTVEDYDALAGPEVAGTIFMECAVDEADYRGEARFVATLVGRGRMLGQIASCRPEADGLGGWLDECAGLGVVGFRRVLHTEPDALSQGALFREGIREIGRRGLVFDMCFTSAQLPLALELADAAEGTALVLDHCGVPDIAGGGLDPWRAHISALAERPHVTCKLSGLTAYCAPGQADLAAVSPYAAHVLDAFGADRVLWGGDWPVVDLGAGLPDWVAMTGEILAGLSEAEGAAVAHGTAMRVYGVGLPG
jgi:predicted TIM-barrel fold metal-dependent hydrolase